MIHFLSTLIYLAIYSTVIQFSIVNGHLVENDNIEHLFNSFIKKFQKPYADQNEYNLRLQVFKNTLNRINHLNSQRKRNTDAIYGLTEFSDLTPDEFKSKMINDRLTISELEMKKKNLNDRHVQNSINQFRSSNSSSRLNNDLFISKQSSLDEFDKLIEKYLSLNSQLDVNLSASQIDNLFRSITSNKFDQFGKNKNSPIKRTKRNANDQFINIYDQILPPNYPRKKDWRDENAISEVDNQGLCGACWAHSVIETIESMAFIKYRLPVNKRLSVQQLIDCSTNNYGCLGGDTCAVLSYIAENKIKLLSAKAYPIRSNSGECRIKNEEVASGLTVLSNFTCTNFTNNEIEMIKLLAEHGPLATIADATQWQDYLGGIIQFNCANEANHAVQIVGYNLGTTEYDVPYYIVRNTWGPNFGINGYLHVAIGGNLCALEERVSALQVDMI